MGAPRTTLWMLGAAGLAALALTTLAPAHAQDGMKPGMGGNMMSGPIQRDPVYFREKVQPILLQHCAGCHASDDEANETRYRLRVPDEADALSDDAIEANFKNVVELLHGTHPSRSRLLQKIVPMTWGGLDHDGGKADGDDFPFELIDAKGELITWVFGGSKTAKPPVAVTAPVKRNVPLGEKVSLDASLSNDPDGDQVRVRWELVEAPLGSSAKIDSATSVKTTFTPDKAGPYVIRLTPDDGKLFGWPRLVKFAGIYGGGERRIDDAPGPATRVETYDRRLIRALYLDLYGRTPTEEEVRTMASLSLDKRVDHMLGDRATWKHWLDEENFYFLLIDRFRPVSDRVVALPEQMQNGAISYRDAHRTIALSTEFNARNPGNDTYVTVVLEQFLGIEVQSKKRLLEAAKKMYDGKPSKIFRTKGTNQSDVVQISLNQPGYTAMFMRRMEDRYIGYPLPDEEHEKWVTFLNENPNEFRKVLREWLLSEHYTSPSRPPKSKTDHQFIRSLFVDLLNRPPAREEFRNMRNALQALADPAPLRGVLAKVILDSGAVVPPAVYDAEAGGKPAGATDDGSRAVRSATLELFQRLLGRDPSPAELDAFTKILQEDGATWRTAALALLTSPHYQYY